MTLPLAIRPPKIALFGPAGRRNVRGAGRQIAGNTFRISAASPGFSGKSASLLKCVLIDMVRNWNAPERRYPEAVRKALEYIRENFHRQLTNREISAAAGYHPYYLDSCFCRCVGVPMRQYLIPIPDFPGPAMLLLTDSAIEAVAESCGFSSPAYFSKWLPGAFRRNARRIPPPGTFQRLLDPHSAIPAVILGGRVAGKLAEGPAEMVHAGKAALFSDGGNSWGTAAEKFSGPSHADYPECTFPEKSHTMPETGVGK